MKIFTHEKYYNNDNKIIPSVTEVLKLLNKPELVEWANWLGFNKINSTIFTQEAAKNGTLVHYFIECNIKKKIINTESLDNLNFKNYKKVMNAFKSFKLWEKDYDPEFKFSELRLHNKKVGGTIDCICKIKDELFIVDFKTSKRVYPSYFIQLAGYNYLLRTVKKIKVDAVGVLVLDKKKHRYDFIQMDIDYLVENYEEIFLLLLNLYQKWNTIIKKDWNGEG